MLTRPYLWTVIALVPLSMTASAQEILGRGAVLTEEEFISAAPPVTSSATSVRTAPLPSRVDLSEWLPPASNQGMQGSCVSWAVVYGIGTALQKMQQPVVNVADITRSPAFLHNSLVSPYNNQDCLKGVSLGRAFKFMEKTGVPHWSEQPYRADECFDTITPSGGMVAFERAVIFRRNTPITAYDLQNIKVELNRRKPLAVVMYVDEFFSHSYVNKDVAAWRMSPSASRRDAHAMVIAGYDDDRITFPDLPRGALKILNSHGREFGDEGYFYLPYTEVKMIEEVGVVEKFKYITGSAKSDNVAERKPRLSRNASVEVYYDPADPLLRVSISGYLLDARGKSAQLVMMFADDDGAYYKASRRVPNDYVDQKDNVVVRSQTFTANSQRVSLSNFAVSIPVSYIPPSLPASGEGERLVPLKVYPLVFVDGVEVGEIGTPKTVTVSILPSSMVQ